MLEVDIDKIMPVTEARDNFNKIVDEVEGSEELYVLTKNGKPAAIVVGVNHLEKLTGESGEAINSMVEKKADETPVVEEVAKTDQAPIAETEPEMPAVETPTTEVPVQTEPAPAETIQTPTPAQSAPETPAAAATPTQTTPPAQSNQVSNDDLFV